MCIRDRDCVVLDNQALISFFVEQMDGRVGEEYQNPAGQGRITLRTAPSEPGPDATQQQNRTYTVKPGDSLWRIAARELGSGRRWQEIYARCV